MNDPPEELRPMVWTQKQRIATTLTLDCTKKIKHDQTSTSLESLWKVFGKFEKSEAFDSARSLTLDSVPEAFCQRDTMRRRPAPQTELTRRFRIQ